MLHGKSPIISLAFILFALQHVDIPASMPSRSPVKIPRSQPAENSPSDPCAPPPKLCCSQEHRQSPPQPCAESNRHAVRQKLPPLLFSFFNPNAFANSSCRNLSKLRAIGSCNFHGISSLYNSTKQLRGLLFSSSLCHHEILLTPLASDLVFSHPTIPRNKHAPTSAPAKYNSVARSAVSHPAHLAN